MRRDDLFERRSVFLDVTGQVVDMPVRIRTCLALLHLLHQSEKFPKRCFPAFWGAGDVRIGGVISPGVLPSIEEQASAPSYTLEGPDDTMPFEPPSAVLDIGLLS